MMLSASRTRTLGLDGSQNKNISGYRNLVNFIKTINVRANNERVADVALQREEAPSENSFFASPSIS